MFFITKRCFNSSCEYVPTFLPSTFFASSNPSSCTQSRQTAPYSFWIFFLEWHGLYPWMWRLWWDPSTLFCVAAVFHGPVCYLIDRVSHFQNPINVNLKLTYHSPPIRHTAHLYARTPHVLPKPKRHCVEFKFVVKHLVTSNQRSSYSNNMISLPGTLSSSNRLGFSRRSVRSSLQPSIRRLCALRNHVNPCPILPRRRWVTYAPDSCLQKKKLSHLPRRTAHLAGSKHLTGSICISVMLESSITISPNPLNRGSISIVLESSKFLSAQSPLSRRLARFVHPLLPHIRGLNRAATYVANLFNQAFNLVQSSFIKRLLGRKLVLWNYIVSTSTVADKDMVKLHVRVFDFLSFLGCWGLRYRHTIDMCKVYVITWPKASRPRQVSCSKGDIFILRG